MISQKKPDNYPLTELSPQAAIKEAHMRKCKGIAWTYNEPTIWYEYTYDTAQLAKQQGLYTVYVTNGYINKEPLIKISEYLDAMNIDVKAFNETFYKKTCKAQLDPIKKTCELAKSLGIHIELTYLVIPQKNDTNTQIQEFCRWIVEKLGKEIPVHFSRFHPDYHMTDINATPINTLIKIKTIAETEGLHYIYLGNIQHSNYENTYCPNCGAVLITRHGFHSQISGIDTNKCQKCKSTIPIIQ
jgi:pyruvate formate lyase activating enzyme